MTAKHASDTPITDAVLDADHGTGTIGATYLFQQLAKHARRMERDRARLIEALRFVLPTAGQMEDWCHERGATTLVRVNDDDFRDAAALLRELGEGEAT